MGEHQAAGAALVGDVGGFARGGVAADGGKVVQGAGAVGALVHQQIHAAEEGAVLGLVVGIARQAHGAAGGFVRDAVAQAGHGVVGIGAGDGEVGVVECAVAGELDDVGQALDLRHAVTAVVEHEIQRAQHLLADGGCGTGDGQQAQVALLDAPVHQQRRKAHAVVDVHVGKEHGVHREGVDVVIEQVHQQRGVAVDEQAVAEGVAGVVVALGLQPVGRAQGAKEGCGHGMSLLFCVFP